MRTTNKADAKFNVTDKFKKRAQELLDESQAMQFAEGLRLNRAAAVVFAREEKRLRNKYGPTDPRTVEMSVRVEASETAKADLFARYVDAVTPPTTAKEGWAVDGFVRTADGVPVGELTVAPYDKEGKPVKGLGSATTDARGFFSIKVDKLPAEPPTEVFMRASKGRKILESNEVRIVPENGATERVEIILLERSGGDKPTEPAQPDKGTVTPIPHDKPVTTTTTTAKPATGATPAAGTDKPVSTGTTPAAGSDKPPVTGTAQPKPSTPVIVTTRPGITAATTVAPARPKRRSTATSAKSSSAKSKAGKAKTAKAKSTAAGSKSTKARTTKSRSTTGTKKASTSKRSTTKKKR